MKSRTRVALLTTVLLGFGATMLIASESAQGTSQSVQPKPARNAPAPHRASYPSVGHQVRTLPQNHRVIMVKKNTYHYHNGVFYKPGARGSYVVVRAPYGARVRTLPPGHVSFFLGSRRYFYVNLTYYLWDAPSAEYVVVEEPAGAEAAVAASESASGEVFVYPAEGQGEEQRSRDRYECHLWAVKESAYDPSAADSDVAYASDYRRAITACLEGRGYAVN